MPADWFPSETHGFLAQYCRHIVTARRTAQLLDELDALVDIKAYDRLHARPDHVPAPARHTTRVSRPRRSTYV